MIGRNRGIARLIGLAALCAVVSSPAHALRVATWNLLVYDDVAARGGRTCRWSRASIPT
jgi:hypothetical protein